MTQKNETVTVNYTDGEGIAYEMTIIRHFTFGDQQFVLTVEKDKHHHEGGACACHDPHNHNHEDSDRSKAKPLYVFEWITGSETGKLQSVSEEILKALAPILEAT